MLMFGRRHRVRTSKAKHRKMNFVQYIMAQTSYHIDRARKAFLLLAAMVHKHTSTKTSIPFVLLYLDMT